MTWPYSLNHTLNTIVAHRKHFLKLGSYLPKETVWLRLKLPLTHICTVLALHPSTSASPQNKQPLNTCVCLLYSGCISVRPGARTSSVPFGLHDACLSPTSPLILLLTPPLSIWKYWWSPDSATIYHKGRTYPMPPIPDPVLAIWLQSGMTKLQREKAQGRLQNTVPLA